MPWSLHLPAWLIHKPAAPLPKPLDPITERLHAVVDEHARVKADNTRSYEARVQSMMDDLFLRMEEGHARNVP